MSFPNFALHATPVNRVASRVSFGESEAWEPKHKGSACIVTFDFPPVPLKDKPEGSPDIAGVRRGFMTALRYHSSKTGKGALWLCRCDCGKYEIRHARRWLKIQDHPDSCQVCGITHKVIHGVSLGQKPSDRIRPEKIEAQIDGGAA